MPRRVRPLPRRLPVLPLGGAVVFPGALRTQVLPAHWVDGPLASVSSEDPLCLALPMRAPEDDPTPASWFPIGILARVVSVVRLPEDETRVALQGLGRVRLEAPRRRAKGWSARAHSLEEEGAEGRL